MGVAVQAGTKLLADLGTSTHGCLTVQQPSFKIAMYTRINISTDIWQPHITVNIVCSSALGQTHVIGPPPTPPLPSAIWTAANCCKGVFYQMGLAT